jgi:metal-responsive CopG/Arc/MetJ family transcriptional regulator
MMTRTNIYLTEVQIKKFKAIATEAGYPVAEIIRRAMDEWLEKYEKKAKIKGRR